jgi:hypothetical protein
MLSICQWPDRFARRFRAQKDATLQIARLAAYLGGRSFAGVIR